MIAFPHCKINIGLRVLSRREDGFHNIETVFYPVKWCDALEAIPANKFSFKAEGINIDGSENENLCVKAYRLLQNEFKIPAIKMCLLKNIPIGAGLGGGSSDAVFTLRMLDGMFDLNLSASQLKTFASQLGSDCAFFLQNKPCIATGKGDQLQPLELDLSSYFIVISYPEIHVNTAWAYGQLSIGNRQFAKPEDLRNVIGSPITTWRKKLINDFEEVVLKHHPEIASIKSTMYKQGALYSSMSGSGSAVYGIFEKEPPKELYSSHHCFMGNIGVLKFQ